MATSSREKRKAAVVSVLNQARAMELQAIHQYLNQLYNLADKDFGALAVNLKLIGIDEMRHAEMFAERIKELGGEPTTESTGPVERGQKVKAVFPFDAKLEDDTVDAYNQFLQVCRENGDSISMKLFETIIDEEQAHFNYFDNVSEHIADLGDTYLAQMAGTPADTGAAARGFVAAQAGA